VNSPTLPPESSGPEGSEPPADDVLAGEYVLGVLDARQRREVQSRLETDRAFARRVADWEHRFAPLLTDVESVSPSEQVWIGICRRLGWVGPETPGRFGLEFWRAAAVLSTVVAIAAIVFAAGHMTTRVPPPAGQLQAQTEPKPVTPLTHDDGTPGWLASVDAARGTVLMVPVPSAPDAQGRTPELWLIPAGQAPRSLGAVSISQSDTVVVPQNARAALVAGSVLAITLEQPAGIPHAAPSGAIIAKGTIQPAA
jgi:anti-sigma-K factor RskA